jgi:hypothetical protein
VLCCTSIGRYPGTVCGAWRAATTLVLVLVVSAGLYTLPAFATVTQPAAQIEAVDLTSGAVTYTVLPPPEAPGFWTALNFGFGPL